ncbi:hypothetical protein D4Q80_01940 [bacterium]|nr:MAG: hypothetical protein D4Q80_01940 [bacterium]
MGHTFRKTVFISLAGHLAVFGFFSFSFGPKIPMVNYAAVSFQGAILNSYDLISRPAFSTGKFSRLFFKKPDTRGLVGKKMDYPSLANYYFKPQFTYALSEKKTGFFKGREESTTYVPAKKESVIMFYPSLPYHFMLYFKDRQAVHIEIMFKVDSYGSRNSLEIKRRISSGNLEVDLLSMRYLSPYLFIQQNRFTPNNWHTVKIDLSPQK